jgi:hypothetical protein
MLHWIGMSSAVALSLSKQVSITLALLRYSAFLIICTSVLCVWRSMNESVVFHRLQLTANSNYSPYCYLVSGVSGRDSWWCCCCIPSDRGCHRCWLLHSEGEGHCAGSQRGLESHRWRGGLNQKQNKTKQNKHNRTDQTKLNHTKSNRINP